MADLLSRHPSAQEGPGDVSRHNHLQAKVQASSNNFNKDVSLVELAKVGKEDKEYQKILKVLMEGKRVDELESTHPSPELVNI